MLVLLVRNFLASKHPAGRQRSTVHQQLSWVQRARSGHIPGRYVRRTAATGIRQLHRQPHWYRTLQGPQRRYSELRLHYTPRTLQDLFLAKSLS